VRGRERSETKGGGERRREGVVAVEAEGWRERLKQRKDGGGREREEQRAYGGERGGLTGMAKRDEPRQLWWREFTSNDGKQKESECKRSGNQE